MGTVPPKHIMAQALKNSASGDVDLVDEIMRLQNEARVKSEIQASKNQEARRAAEKAAQTSTREGVKVTQYPYVEPKPSAGKPAGGSGGRGGSMRGIGGGGGSLPGMEDAMRKGGEVKSYAKGGSVKGAGIAQRGVRKCKMV